MENIRLSAEVPSCRPRDTTMEERYRHLHYDQNVAPPFWVHKSPKAVPLARFKRNLPTIPKKKGKDSKKAEHLEIPFHPRHRKDKYGSVSAHSTSAIYGAIRAPHYHAVYGPSDMWYASVRSLNRNIRRDVYAAETFEWRETLYEESAKEVFTVTSQVEMISRPPCMCVVRRRHPHEQASISKSRIPRCKICSPVLSNNASANSSQPLVKRPSGIPEKIKSPVLEKVDTKHEPPSRMSGYKKCLTGSKYKNVTLKGLSTKESRKISRKSILECDVTAYDLIKNVAKTQSVSEIDDSDIDDSLKDNALDRINRIKSVNYENKPKPVSSPKVPSRSPMNKNHSSTFKKSQSENCIYSESHSVLVGGQRIFTDNCTPKSPVLTGNMDSGDELEDINQNLANSNWRKISMSEESVCIPDPDYDFSDDSDDSTVINSNYIDPKFTYSPPTVRKSAAELYHGLGYGSRELSKSMSSLQSDETFVPSIYTNRPNFSNWIPEPHDCDNFETSIRDEISKAEESDAEVEFPKVADAPCNTALNPMQDSKCESSSDCSSSGGTMSSDYPTWTSSSSNELKSILKNKKTRSRFMKPVQDISIVPDHLDEFKEKKKQVQFESGSADENIQTSNDNKEVFVCDDRNNFTQNLPTEVNDIYETLDEPNNDKNAGGDMSEIRPNIKDSPEGACGFDKNESNDALSSSSLSSSIKNGSNAIINSSSKEWNETSQPPVQPPKLSPCRSTSLEDLRNGNHQGTKETEKDQTKRRTTLPKRRFSDLHLHLLLCPTASFCRDGSSGDDIPLKVATQRAHRSLPESPRELDEIPSFCFDLFDKNSKEKVLSSRSVFYVPVEGNTQISDAGSRMQSEASKGAMVSPSTKDKSSHFQPSSENVEILDPALSENALTLDPFDTTKDNLENEYEHLDPIYEELSEVSNSTKESEPKSFFEGASKTDILSYLADAKERGLSTEGLSEDEKVIIEDDDDDEKVLSDEDIGEKSHITSKGSIDRKVLLKIEEDTEREALESENINSEISKNSRVSEVERNDSGVGTETSKPSRMKVLPVDWEEQLCADCDHQVEPLEDEKSGLLYSPLVCRKCEFRRSERKEIIIEFVDTECKYGRDLRIIKEEFYKPMEIAGLLAKDQLCSIFLNLDELTAVNTKFSEKLQDALDIAMEHGDEDYTTVNIGKIFLETSSMLHAFETYCVKQASASVLLSNLEKERELLRIFLRVSQMENTLLRRMNLPAFLMVPVQRVTRYPLLLSRLHKVTPIHHKDRNALKEAQQKVELHLEHINQQTKGVGGTKIWRRISNISTSHRRLGKDIGCIKLRKMALEVLNWKQDEARFVIAGKLLLTQITDYPWNKKGRTVKFTSLHALLVALGKPNSNYRPESMSSDNTILFPRNTGIRNASLVLMKEKSGRFITVREPLYLGNCVISCEEETNDVFEIQEYTTKEAYLLKGETKKDTKEWLKQLRYHAKDLGTWRKRRNALANIMINGMIRQ